MPRSLALTVLAAALCAASAAHAQADATRPWYVGASQAFRSESNAFAAGSDTSSTTSLQGGVNTTFGRQRVRADATLRHQRYNRNDALNNNGHDLSGAFDWATAGRLSGSITGLSSERLSRLTVPSGAATRNLERTGDVGARVRLGEFGPLGIEAGGGAREQSYSAPEFDSREYRQNRANFGVTYAGGGPLTVGAGVAAQNYNYPRFLEPLPGQFVADHARRRDAYFTALWVPTGRSAVNGRINVGNTKYDLNTSRNFSGATGSVAWDWRPTAKLHFVTTLAREIGEETAYSTLSSGLLPVATPVTPDAAPVPAAPTLPVGTSFQALTAESRIVNQLSLAADYEATAKITLVSGLSLSRNSRTGGGGSDRITHVELGGRWEPTRSLTFGCDVTQESRSGSSSARSFGCYGQILLN